ncbi:MAG: hypothetical protein ACRELG_23440, partial [Gemmataceae bacterium]
MGSAIVSTTTVEMRYLPRGESARRDGLRMAKNCRRKLRNQIDKAGLPTGVSVPFVPQLDRNNKGKEIIRKAAVRHGPKNGKKGYVDTKDRIGIKD